MTPKRQKHTNTLSALKRKELSASKTGPFIPSGSGSHTNVLKSGGLNRK
jgi:hypothetical protein